MPSSKDPLRINDPVLRNRIKVVIDRCIQVWDRPILVHYTDHGVEHSRRVAQHLSELAIGLTGPLNDPERFVLTAASYVHDVGMQTTRRAKNAVGALTREDFDLIRAGHSVESAEWIVDGARGARDLPSLGLEADEYLDVIARVSRAHSKFNLAELPEVERRNNAPIRTRLLAALLLIADELDLDTRRVKMPQLSAMDVPSDSMRHWLKHHYVDGCEVASGGAVVLDVAFPSHYRGVQAQALVNEITEPLKSKLADLTISGTLAEAGLNLLVVEPRVTFVDDGRKQPLPEDLGIQVQGAIRDIDITDLKSFPEDRIYPILNATYYGTDLRDMEAKELHEFNQLHSNAIQAVGALGRVQTRMLQRLLGKNIEQQLRESRLPLELGAFLTLRAHVRFVHQSKKILMPEWLYDTPLPPFSDEDVWAYMKGELEAVFFRQQGDYERWRGIVAAALGRNAVLVSNLDAFTDKLAERVTVTAVITNRFSRLNDPGMMLGLESLTDIPRDVLERYKELSGSWDKPAQATDGAATKMDVVGQS